jgi:hypothetical protein
MSDISQPCPRCGSTDAVEIIYGDPDVELGEAARRGEVVLGGCVIGPESPDYECRTCHEPLPWVRRDDRLEAEAHEDHAGEDDDEEAELQDRDALHGGDGRLERR